jgi:hypothetical protein
MKPESPRKEPKFIQLHAKEAVTNLETGKLFT